MDGNITDTPPVIVVPREEDRPRWQQIADEDADARGTHGQARATDSAADFDKWLDEEPRPKISRPADPADEVFALRSTAR